MRFSEIALVAFIRLGRDSCEVLATPPGRMTKLESPSDSILSSFTSSSFSSNLSGLLENAPKSDFLG
jgi:hypothetical protein